MRTELKALLAALAVFATSLAAPHAHGATYVIDSSQSSITITGLALGFIPIIAQSAGSNVAVIEGSLDIDASGGNINFISSVADAVEKPGPFNPGIISGDPPVAGPNAPADIALFLGNASTGRLALRDFVVSVTGTSPLVGNDFDLMSLLLTVSDGSLDYNVPFASLVGHLEIAGETASPTGGTGSLVGTTLTIPINVSLEFEVLAGDPPGTAVVNLQGQIVAELVPEPGAIVMLGLGSVSLIAVGRRRFRRA